jgi:hypothetical protein
MTTRTTVTVLNLRGNNGDTDLLLLVRHRIEAIGTLVFGGPLLGPGDDFAPGILAFVLYANKKLPIFLVPTGIFIVIFVAHDSPWS